VRYFSTEQFLQLKSYSYLENDTKTFERLAFFLNQNLRPDFSFSIIEEYPSLFKPYPGGVSYYIESENSIASHVLTLIRTYYHSSFSLKIGLIGSVVTAPKFRGRGMARTLIKHACEIFRKENCEICLLWSGNNKFYEPLGFYRAGKEKDLIFNTEVISDNDSQIREFEFDRDVGSIWRLYLKHSGHLDRSLEEQKRLCKIPRTRIFVLEEDNKIISYIAINKGADFENYIHEWGGDIASVFKIISHAQKKIKKELVLISPQETDCDYMKSFECKNGVLGLIKVLNKKKLLLTYQSYLNALSIKSHYNQTNDIFHYENISYQLSSDKMVLDLVFGTEDNIFPNIKLPFFLWGFDSI